MDIKDTVTITCASIPQREEGLKQVVHDLLPQCDKMYICLNDYAYIPKFLNNPKIAYIHLLGKDTISDHGKFYWDTQITGYHFTVDDDIDYPADYVQHTVEMIEAYGRKAVVGYHGTDLLLRGGKLLTENKVSIKRLRFGDPLLVDRRVFMLGTGVLAYHTNTMRFPYNSLRQGGTDEQVALHCQQLEIPMVCLAHAEGWLVDNWKMSTLQNIGGNPMYDGIALSRIRGHEQWHLPALNAVRTPIKEKPHHAAMP